MHLGILTPEYPHSRTTPAAGIGTSIRNLAGALAKKGIEVSVFIYSQKEDAIINEDNIKIHLIKHRNYPYVGWYLYRKFLQNYLNKYIAADKIDAIEAPDWTGITAFMKLRAPLVIRFHGSDGYFCHLEGRKQKKKNFIFEKKAMKGADHLISVSDFTARETAKIFDLKKEIRVIPNGVDAEKFQPSTTAPEPFKILYFGSVIRKKGVIELGGIFDRLHKTLPEASLHFVGKDVVDYLTRRSTRELVSEQLSEEAANKVKWIGPLPYEQVREEIATASVVVLPSLAEALPMTWLEAMAMEKSLVTSNIGWASEVMIDRETGFTADPKDHTNYADRIRELLVDRDLASEFGKAARKRVLEKFSIDIIAEENISFYNNLVQDKKNR